MPRYHWHVVAMPGQSDTQIGESVSWQDNMLPTIQAEADKKQFDGNFAVTFDEFITAAENIPNFFVELDGSFVWRSLEPPWQIDGVVFDRDEYVSQIELKGNSPREPVAHLLKMVGWPEQPTVFEMIQLGVFVDATTFLETVCRQGLSVD